MTGRTIERRKAMVVGVTPGEAYAKLQRKAQAGLVHSAGPQAAQIPTGPLAGQWAIPHWEIVRPARKPFWTGPRKALGVLSLAGALTGLVWWVLATISALALGALLVTVLAVFCAVVHRATSVTVTTTTTTRVSR